MSDWQTAWRRARYEQVHNEQVVSQFVKASQREFRSETFEKLLFESLNLKIPQRYVDLSTQCVWLCKAVFMD